MGVVYIWPRFCSGCVQQYIIYIYMYSIYILYDALGLPSRRDYSLMWKYSRLDSKWVEEEKGKRARGKSLQDVRRVTMRVTPHELNMSSLSEFRCFAPCTPPALFSPALLQLHTSAV